MVCLFSLFERQFGQILSALFALFLRPFLLINDSLQTFWRHVGQFYHDQFSVNGQLDLQQVFFQFIGAVLYTIFFFGFYYSEYHLLSLSMTAAGIDAGQHDSLLGAGSLTSLALIACPLFWGAVLLDLSGMTNTAPWRDAFNENWKGHLLFIALFSLFLSLLVSISLGLFRGKVIADENLNSTNYAASFDNGLTDSSTGLISSKPSLSESAVNQNTGGVYYWIPIIANVCIPVLVGVSGVFSSWGVVTLIKFIMLIVGFLIISPLGLLLIVSSLLVNVIDRLYQLFDTIIQLFTAAGNRFMGVFGWRPAEPKQPQDQLNHTDTEQERNENNAFSQNNQEPSAEEEPMSPSIEDWNPINKKGD
jgi:hypothetical protein